MSENPIAYITGFYGGYQTINVIDGTVLPNGTPLYAAPPNPWKPSNQDYDKSIHHNPDAMAWAELFIDTFPDCGIGKDLIFGWFANAMMAMHDYQEQKRKPLSDEQILNIASNPLITPCSPWWLKDDVITGDVQNAAKAFARAIETAHGITS